MIDCSGQIAYYYCHLLFIKQVVHSIWFWHGQ